MLDTSLNHFKSVFSHKFFVAPADRNYFLARFAKTYGMNEEFWWQSLQAIEKYLKAGLVLNNVGVKKDFGHNIEKLWKAHLDTFGDCAVQTLSKPKNLNDQFWNDTPLERFISRVNTMGQPDSRYGLVSFSNSEDDLFMLDQLVFELRRRTIGLEWVVGKDWEDSSLQKFEGQSYRTVIQQMPNHQIREMKVPTGDFKTAGANLEDLYYAWNLAFIRDIEDIERPAPATVAPSFAGFGNSYLYLLRESLNETDMTATGLDSINWLLDNIQIGRCAERDFRDILAKSKKRV